MRAQAGLWVAFALAVLGGGLIGWGFGRDSVPEQVVNQPVCSIEHYSGHPACPPAVGSRVVATWVGGLVAVATWTGDFWFFDEPVLGGSFAFEHPIAWSEL